MTSSDPRLSVCVPLFRPSLRHLEQQAAGLAANASVITEVVLADDTPQPELDDRIVSTYTTALPCATVRYLRRGGPSGMVANWNFACGAATGEYLLNLGQDDVLRPDALPTALRAWRRRRPDAVFVAWGECYIDDSGAPMAPPVHANDRSLIYSPGAWYCMSYEAAVHLALRNGQVLGPPSCTLMRRDAWEETGGYDPAFGHSADVDLLLRMLRRGPGLYASMPLTDWRLHGGNLTKHNVMARIASHDRWLLHARYSRTVPSSALQRRRWLSYLCTHELNDAVRFVRRGHLGAATSAMRDAVRALLRCGPIPVLEQAIEEWRIKNNDATYASSLILSAEDGAEQRQPTVGATR
jgi:hypothetical protein